MAKKSAMGKSSSMSCACCSSGATNTAEDQIRDIINWVSVKKGEEDQDTTTKIHPATAKALVKKLETLAKSVGTICE